MIGTKKLLTATKNSDNLQNTILVTGGTGMVGRNLKKLLPKAAYLGSKNCNLIKQNEIKELFSWSKFNRIIHLAAKVGGLEDNMKKQYDYYYENIMMNSMLLEYARTSGIKHFMAILSTCIYPSVASKYPMTEDMIDESPPAPSNYGYAVAKRALASSINCLNKQYGLNYNYLIPCNLYGINDKYGDNSHYVAALIKKIYDAKKANKKTITLMGDGKPLRQFMYAEDLARVIKLCIENNITENINVAPDELYTIDEIAKIALIACDAEHLKIVYKNKNLVGQHRKDCDNSKFKKLFPNFRFTTLKAGIKKTYKQYCKDNN